MRAASTVAEAQAHADDLRAELTRRQVHPDVLRFCRAELLQQNYWLPVLPGWFSWRLLQRMDYA